MHIPAALARQVWRRAARCCEYCCLSQDFDDSPFEIDHIIPRKHGGATIARNLALSCYHDNRCKGYDISGLDPKTGRLMPLFHPRRQQWSRHFRWHGAYLIGRTPVGRVTVAVLELNDPLRVELRQRLIDEALFPPASNAR
jgi:HNH endonuclease